MRLPSILFACVAMAFGCTSCSRTPAAHVNDLIMTRDQPKFRVTLVDGQAPKRKKNPFMDVPPLIVITPGRHTLTIQKGLSDPPDEKVYKIDVDAVDKEVYNLISKDGEPSLVQAK